MILDHPDLHKYIEKTVGMPRFICIDDLFGGENLVSGPCAKCRILLILADETQQELLRNWVRLKGIDDNLVISLYDLKSPWDPDDSGFQNEVSPLILNVCAEVLEQQ